MGFVRRVARAGAVGALGIGALLLPSAHAATAKPILGPIEFQDTFNTPIVNPNNWSIMLGEWPSYSQVYSPTEVKTDSQGLHLLATQPYPTTVNLAGGITSVQSFLYGQYDVIARLPSDDGLWPAAWLGAKDGNGEIDIYEAHGSHPTWFQTTVHDWNNGVEDPPQCVQVGKGNWHPNSSCADAKNLPATNYHLDYHDWGMTWTPTGITFTMDAKKYWSTKWSPSTPMQLYLNVAMGTYWDGWPNSTDVWPASMDIQSVTVRSLAG